MTEMQILNPITELIFLAPDNNRVEHTIYASHFSLDASRPIIAEASVAANGSQEDLEFISRICLNPFRIYVNGWFYSGNARITYVTQTFENNRLVLLMNFVFNSNELQSSFEFEENFELDKELLDWKLLGF